MSWSDYDEDPDWAGLALFLICCVIAVAWILKIG